MTTFDDRKKAYENKFAHDRETDFKILARRNKMLGYWIADMLRLDEDERESYANEIVEVDVKSVRRTDLMDKVQGDLQKGGFNMDEREIREQMYKLLVLAREQINS